MSKLIKSILTAFAAILFSCSLNAASERDLRDLQDWAKKVDEERRKTQLEELEKSLYDTRSADKHTLTLLFGFIGISLILTITWKIFELEIKDRLFPPKVNGDENERLLNEAALRLAENKLEPLKQVDIYNLTIDDIAKQTSKPIFVVRDCLKTLGWNAADFDGRQAQSFDEKVKNEAIKLARTYSNKDELRTVARERALYVQKLEDLKILESKLTPSKIPIYLTIYASDPAHQLIWRVICLDNKKDLARGYSQFSESFHWDGSYRGFEIGKNIEYDTYFNPQEMNANVTIRIYPSGFSSGVRYIGLFLSSVSMAHEDLAFHSLVKVGYSSHGFFGNTTFVEINCDCAEESQLLLGLVDLNGIPKPRFLSANGVKAEITDAFIEEDLGSRLVLKGLQRACKSFLETNA